MKAKVITAVVGTENMFASAQNGRLYKVQLVAGAAATGTCKIYDASSGTSTQIASLSATQGTRDYFTPKKPVHVGTNLRVIVAGTGAEAIICYD